MSHRLPSTIELLESRIAPATLLSPTTVTYQDIDGDTVTIKTSKPIFTEANVNTILTFSTGTVTEPSETSNDLAQQLQFIALTADQAGVNITITAKASKMLGGDGLADVGAISAVGVDLGSITIPGDLGQIDAGNATATTLAVKSLSVLSMGARGTDTQTAGGSLASALVGGVGSLTIKGDLQNASLTITGGFVPSDPLFNGIGKLSIGGSIFGTTAGTGLIDLDGGIGSIALGGHLQGGAGTNSGRIEADGPIGNVTIKGSINGDGGAGSGTLKSFVSLGVVKVGRDLQGGTGDDSGLIDGGTLIKAVTIGGSMFGNDGEESGSIIAEDFNGKILKVTVGRDIVGGVGDESAYIHAGTQLGPVKVGGSVRGGPGELSALIYGGSANTDPHFMTSVTIGGDLIGGTGDNSGSLGGAFDVAGFLQALTVGKINIKGSVIGNGPRSGAITGGTFQSITIGGDLIGSPDALAANNATIQADISIKTLKINGSVLGGEVFSAQISAATIDTLQIGRNLEGGVGQGSGRIVTSSAGIKTLTIGGDISSGGATGSGSIQIAGTLGSLSVKGSITGTAAFPVQIAASGIPLQAMAAAAVPKPNVAFGKVAITGSASYLQLLGGFGANNQTPINADVSIGAVSVGGNWTAGSISAGIDPDADTFFGGTDDSVGTLRNDAAILSRIASITIKGRVLGSADPETYGFVAEQIGKIKVGKVSYAALTEDAPSVSLSPTGNVFARLIGAPINV